MKIKFIAALLATLISPLASAAYLNAGKITKVSTNSSAVFGIYVTPSHGPCEDTTQPGKSIWLYIYKSEMDVEGWKSLQSLSLVAYAQGKTVEVYGEDSGCANLKFNNLQIRD